MNPSFLAFSPVYAVRLSYIGAVNTEQSRIPRQYNISAIDGNRTSFVQSGIGYTNRQESSQVNVALATQYFNRIGFGIGGKAKIPQEGISFVMDGVFSMTWILTHRVKLAWIIDNLFESEQSRGLLGARNREVTFGTEVSLTPDLLLYVDPHWSRGNWGVQGGLEALFPYNFSLRMGAFGNSISPFPTVIGDGYGLGVGWLLPKVSFDYSYSRILQGSLVAHQIEMTIYF